MANVIEILITAKDDASDIVGKSVGVIGSLGTAAGTVLVAGLGAAVAGIGAMVGGLGLATSEAMAAEEVQAQLMARLRSTGGVAGVTAEMANELASSLQGVTRFSDEQILSGENLLLTFTNIGKDIFPTATKTMLNMSAALGTDLKGSAIQLGKALQDPITGVAALRRVGVNFTEEQQNTIKALVESNNLYAAQTLILTELETEFGGAAEAAGKTFGGSLDIIKNQISDVLEGVGGALIPLLSTLVEQGFKPLLPVIQDVATQFTTFLQSPAVRSGVDGLVSGIRALIDAGQGLFDIFFKGDFTGGIFGLMEDDPIIDILFRIRDGFLQIATTVQTFINFIGQGQIEQAFANIFGPEIAADVMDFINSIQNLASAFASSFPTMQSEGASFGEWFRRVLGESLPQIIRNLTGAVNAFAAFWREWGDDIIRVLQILARTIVAIANSELTMFTGIFTAALQLLTGNWRGAMDTLSNSTRSSLNSATQVADQSLDQFTNTWADNFRMLGIIINRFSMEYFQAVGRIVTGTISDLAKLPISAIKAGTDMMLGLARGIANSAGRVLEEVSRLIGNILSSFARLLGLRSPSTVLMDFGMLSGEGYAIGLDKSRGLIASAAGAAVGSVTQPFGSSAVNNVRNSSTQINFYPSGDIDLARIEAIVRRVIGGK